MGLGFGVFKCTILLLVYAPVLQSGLFVLYTSMAKLVDAVASKASGLKTVQVQILLGVHHTIVASEMAQQLDLESRLLRVRLPPVVQSLTGLWK